MQIMRMECALCVSPNYPNQLFQLFQTILVELQFQERFMVFAGPVIK